MNPICSMGFKDTGEFTAGRRPEDGDDRERWGETAEVHRDEMGYGLPMRQAINSEFNQRPWGAAREKITCKS